MKNKKASSISITLLVFMILILCGLSLFIFATSENKFSQKVEIIGEMNNFYSENQLFEFYLYNTAKNVILQNPQIENSQDFIKNFKAELIFDASNEAIASDYLEQMSNAVYDVSIDKTNGVKVLIFRIKGFIFQKNPGLDGSNQLGYIRATKDISFRIYF